MSSSNNVISGFGRNIVLGGLAGNGLPTVATSLLQNEDFEVPGAAPGEASNWTTEIVYSDVEYASFTRPGLAIVVTAIPAEQPELGFTIVHQIDGTISILQAANEEDAAEDFEEGWDNNEQFASGLADNAVSFATFQNNKTEPFDAGWSNDEGLLDILAETLTSLATFSVHTDPFTGFIVVNQFENYEGYWPASAIQPYTTAIPNVIFGTSDPTTLTDPGQYNAGNQITTTDINGFAQYADVLILTVTAVPKTPFNLIIHYLDKDDLVCLASVTVPQDLPIGASVTVAGTVSTGIRYIDTVDEDPTNGFPGLIFEGDPGVLFDSGNNVQATWIRAEFT